MPTAEPGPAIDGGAHIRTVRRRPDQVSDRLRAAAGSIEHQTSHADRQTAGSARRCTSRRAWGAEPSRRRRICIAISSKQQPGFSAAARSEQRGQLDRADFCFGPGSRLLAVDIAANSRAAKLRFVANTRVRRAVAGTVNAIVSGLCALSASWASWAVSGY
jgi:hypothetical protein